MDQRTPVETRPGGDEPSVDERLAALERVVDRVVRKLDLAAALFEMRPADRHAPPPLHAGDSGRITVPDLDPGASSTAGDSARITRELVGAIQRSDHPAESPARLDWSVAHADVERADNRRALDLYEAVWTYLNAIEDAEAPATVNLHRKAYLEASELVRELLGEQAREDYNHLVDRLADEYSALGEQHRGAARAALAHLANLRKALSDNVGPATEPEMVALRLVGAIQRGRRLVDEALVVASKLDDLLVGFRDIAQVAEDLAGADDDRLATLYEEVHEHDLSKVFAYIAGRIIDGFGTPIDPPTDLEKLRHALGRGQ